MIEETRFNRRKYMAGTGTEYQLGMELVIDSSTDKQRYFVSIDGDIFGPGMFSFSAEDSLISAVNRARTVLNIIDDELLAFMYEFGLR